MASDPTCAKRYYEAPTLAKSTMDVTEKVPFEINDTESLDHKETTCPISDEYKVPRVNVNKDHHDTADHHIARVY